MPHVPRPPFRRKYLIEALEPRVLLSADLPVVPPPLPDPLPPCPPAEAMAAPAGGEPPPQFEFDTSDMAADFASALAPEPAAAAGPTEIAFVDARVVGQGALTIERDGLLVVVLDANEDGIAQISETLAQHRDLKAVHLLAHGSAGQTLLGNTVLDAGNAERVSAWSASLAQEGDLLLYGCNIADGEPGISFVQKLAAYSGADVGASTDRTGSASLGGDWTLEFTAGVLETSSLAFEDWGHLLVTVNATTGSDSLSTPSAADNTTYVWTNATLGGTDTISDGGGTDTVDFSGVSTALTFTIGTGGLVSVSGTNVNVTVTSGSIENIIGGSGQNSFVFQAGGAVAGTITGGAAADTLDYSAYSTDVSVNLGTGSATGTAGASGIENVTGGSGNDTLIGSIGANVLNGGGGNDILRGGGGADTIIGGGGTDTLSYAGDSTDLTFTISSTAGTVSVTGLAVAATGIENLIGGSGDNTFDIQTGAMLAGTLNGGVGGTNTLSYAGYATSGATVNLATGSATGVTGAVSNIQNVTGSAGNDDITGDGADNVLAGGAGDDTYRFADAWGNDTITEAPGGGNDTLQFSAVTAATALSIRFSGTTGSVTVEDDPDAPAHSAIAGNMENVVAGAGDDTFSFASGFALVGSIDGGAGDDILDYSEYGGNLDPDDIDFAGGAAPGIVGAADNFEFIQHPTDAVTGMQALFNALRDGVGQTIGQVTLPLIGDAISVGITNFLDEMELAMLGDGAPGGKDGLIEGLLTDDDSLSTDDIVEDKLSTITLSHDIGSGSMPATLSVIFDASQLISDQIFEIRMVIEGTIFHEEVDIDFASALPGLGLSIESTGGLEVDLSYVLDLGIGLDFKPGGGFYIDTNGQDDADPSDDEEFTLTLSAGVTDGTVISATLGFLGMTLTDQTAADDTVANPDDGQASGLSGTFAIDLLDPGTDADDGHLKFSELSGAAPEDLIEAHLTAEADVDVVGVLDMGTDILPSISVILHYNQQFADVTLAFGGNSTATFGGTPEILFEDVTLDLGSFFSGFLEPILAEIKKVTEPLQPVVDVLTAPLPIFSDLEFLSAQFNYDGDPDNEVSLLDLAGTLLGQTKYGPVVTAISAIADLITFVNNIPIDEADGLKINFGDWAFSGTDMRVGDALKTASAPSSTNEDPGAQLNSADNAIGSQIDDSPENAQKKGALAKLRSATDGFNVPLLTSPSTVFSLLMGKDVPLFTYDLPDLDFVFALNIRVPLFGPLFMKLSGTVSAEIDAGFGFSTAGIRAFLVSNDPADIFLKGFYLNDHWSGGTDNPEVTITSTLAAYAALGIGGLVEAGVGGGVTATIEFDLNDVSTSTDGQVFLNEFIFIAGTNPLCIFDIHGKLEAFLEAYVWVGLDLGLFGTITIFYDNWELARVTIAEFIHHCDIADVPTLAHMNGNELVLHVGANGSLRDGTVTDWHTGYEDESYSVVRGMFDHDENEATAKIDRIAVSWNGFTEYYDPAAVLKITGDAGSGDDVITIGKDIAAEVTLSGGDGDDVLRASGSGLVFLQGGAGNDKLVGNASKISNSGTHSVTGSTRDRFVGGAGNDIILGSGAADDIFGGSSAADTSESGNDVIKGNAGDDTIYGGNESGSTGQKANGDTIDGGAGNDTIFGGAGADVIKGGLGADTIDGGAGADSITGNAGIDTLTGGSGADTFFWTSGDGADVVTGGTDGGTEPTDAFIASSFATTGEAITLAKSGSDTQLTWDAIGAGTPTTFTLVGIEKFQLNAGVGADVITINDLAGTTVKEVGISLGATVQDVEVSDGPNPEDFHLETVTTLDTGVDSVRIDAGNSADQFTGQTTTDAVTGLTVVNMSRTGAATISYSISQSDSARDTFLLQTFDGNDGIDLSAVRVASFASTTLDSGAGNDIVFGTQFADTINSGAGDDKVSGNAGVDTFVDASGTDTLSEVNHGAQNIVYNPVTGAVTSSSTSTSYFNLKGADFTLDGNTLTIAHAATETENIAAFEEVSLVAASNPTGYVAGGDSNTFTVQNWQKVARLDGGQGSDTYSITFAGSGSGKITENDSVHVAGDVDRMYLYGTSGVDLFSFKANNDDWQVDDDGDGVVDAGDPFVDADLILTDGSVSLLHGGSDVETVNYTHSERLEVRAGDGNDAITVDDNALTLYVYGEGGDDSFLIGRVTSSHEDPPGSGIVIADSITNGVSSESFFFGDFGEVLQTSGPNANDPRNPYIDPATGKTVEINVAQSGNDSFEVNHNKAPVWLFGNAGDDRFTVNAVLIDTGGSPDNPSNVSGGTGTNTITYLQNAPVNIDGGSGNDIVVVNGTGIGDTFIVAVVLEDHDSDPLTPDVERQKVIGAGLQINMKNVERLEVNGAGGDDRIHVFSTLPEIEVIISGGSGDDTIHIGGQEVSIVIDPPDYISDPPAYTFDAPPYIDHWESVTWSWGDYWYFNWTWPLWHYQPLVTYTWWYPVWVDPPPVTIDPPPTIIDPPAFDFASGPRIELTGIKGKLRVEAGDLDNTGGLNDNDRIVVHNQAGDTANTGLLTTGDHDDDALSADVGYLEGLGMARPVYDTDGITIIGSMVGGMYYLGAENLDIHLNDDAAESDDFTVAYTDPDTTTTVFLGQGDDHVRVKAVNGVLQLDGGAGNDSFDVWSDANLLDGIAGTLRINGGAGTDGVDVRDTADTLDDSATLTSSALTGLDMAGSIQYGAFATQTFTYSYLFQTVADPGPPAVINAVNNAQTFTLAYGPIETLVIGTGSGHDVIDVLGTQAATTINTNDGNDTINVSSDGALLGGTLDDVNGALTLHAGAGDNTLNVSDFGDPDADGAVTITSSTIAGLAPALITYDTTNRFTGGVNLWAGRGSDVVAIASALLADVTTFYANEGDDSVTVANLTGGASRLLAVHGDAGDDTLDASAIAGSNVTVVLFGDSGQENYLGTDKTLLSLTGVASSVIGSPGNDTLLAGAGPAILVGGGNNPGSAVNSGRDRLTGAGFDDVLIGDDGTAAFNAGIVTSIASVGTAGGDDQIDAGDGRNYIVGGVGADAITAGSGDDVVLGDNGTVTYTTAGIIVNAASSDPAAGGGDTVAAGEGDNVVLGGAGGDTIGAGGGNDVLVGDNATVTWDPATGFVTQFASLGTDGGDDTIGAGEGRNLVLGGVGSDGVTSGAGDDVVLGDNGVVNFTSLGVITDATSTDLGQGAGESLDAGGGNNVVLGGAGGDTITTLGGVDVIIGDNGAATWSAGIVTQVRSTDTVAGTGGDDVIGAGEGRNYVVGGVGADGVTAGAGDDVVLGDNGIVNFDAAGTITDASVTEIGLGGADSVAAGEGNNVVLAGAGGDTVAAGAGDDVVIGDSGEVVYTAGVVTQFRSTDTSEATGGGDTIGAGEGRNLVLGGAGADDIAAGAGDDVVLGDNGQALFTAAGVITLFETTDLALGGGDSVSAGAGRNIVSGGFGGDAVTTLGGDDLILGDNGRFSFAGGLLSEAVTTDTSAATGGDDTLDAGDGNNVVLGGVGNDTVTAGAGNDVVIGDNGIVQYDGAGLLALAEVRDPLLAGNDAISSDGGDDLVLGGQGADTIDGGDGNDVLLGDGGTATFSGGSLTMVIGDSLVGGDDTIFGGAGSDILLGGAGADALQANFFDDVFTGENARITFSGGRVTLIELLGNPDLVLQQLFELYTGPQDDGAVVVLENEPEEDGESGAGGPGLADLGTEGIYASEETALVLAPGSATFTFGRGAPLAQLPELLRNVVLELYLGDGTPPPSHSGETGTPPADSPPADAGQPSADSEAPLSALAALAPAAGEAAARQDDDVALQAGAAALLGLQSLGSAHRRATLDRAAFERAPAFAGRGIDW